MVRNDYQISTNLLVVITKILVIFDMYKKSQ